MTVLVTVLLPALLLVLALVVDGTSQLRVQSRAEAVAAETARAAGTAINTRSNTIQLDPAAAQHAAHAYLARTGHTGSVHISPGGTVQATAVHTEPAAIGLLGHELRATGEATATVSTGTNSSGGAS